MGKSICLLCKEIAKETLKPREFWGNYKELILTDDDNHWSEVIEAVKKTSPEYQKELADFWSK